MINLSTIPMWEIVFIFGLRIIGFFILLLVLFRAIQEYRVKQTDVKKTRILLFVIVGSLFFSSLLPLYQTACFLLTGCFDQSQLIPFSIIASVNNLISSIGFMIVYYTKE